MMVWGRFKIVVVEASFIEIGSSFPFQAEVSNDFRLVYRTLPTARDREAA